MLKQQLEQDLKTALLSGDKVKVSTLRGLKSVILYAEVAEGVRDQGLTDEQFIGLLTKEAKKRQESADLYKKGNEPERAVSELAEKGIIEAYLPQQLSDVELDQVIESVVAECNATDQSAMGQVIGMVKQKVGATAEGARIAKMVKERLGG